MKNADPCEKLTAREIEIADRIILEYSDKEISADKKISLATVKTHLAAMRCKLGVRSRTGIAIAWDRFVQKKSVEGEQTKVVVGILRKMIRKLEGSGGE